MTTVNIGRPVIFKAASFTFGLWMAASPVYGAQVEDRSASDLIKSLTVSNQGPIIFDCARSWGKYEKGVRIVDALARLHDAAIPEIERGLDSIVRDGQPSALAGNAWVLMEAYARIKGHDAFARLRAMADDPTLDFLQNSLGRSLARSLGLTSYVSSSGQLLVDSFNCKGFFEPRAVLDQLILAWEKNDRQSVERRLGPSGREALNRLLEGSAWNEIRADLWQVKAGVAAVGYRFDSMGWWSTLEEGSETTLNGGLPESAEIDTTFTNRKGSNCGTYHVKFIKTDDENFPTYVVDNSDLKSFLRLISSCAAQ